MALPANMKTNPSPLRIAIIAGESSGDLLGGKLMKALKAHYPATIEFLGIGGDRMKEEGLVYWTFIEFRDSNRQLGYKITPHGRVT